MALNNNDSFTPPAATGIEAGVLTLRDVSVKSAGRSLSSLYSNKRISLLAPFAGMVKDGLLRASDITSSKKLKTALASLREKDALQKMPETIMTQLYNSFWGALNNVVAVAKADKRYEEAWKRLITNLEVGSIAIKQQLGREIRIEYSYGWNASVYPELLFNQLTVTSVWQNYVFVNRDYHQYGLLSMDAERRRLLSDLFFGKGFRLPQLIPTLPDPSRLHTEDFEASMPSDIMTLDGVALNGSMLSANGSITAAAVKKVKAQTPVGSFGALPGTWPVDRVEMLCLTYFTLLNIKGGKDPFDLQTLARFAVDKMPRMLVGPMFNTFIPSLQGFTKTWTADSYAPDVAACVNDILKQAHKEWMSLHNFRMQLLCTSAAGTRNYIYLCLFNDRSIDKAKLSRRSETKTDNADDTPIDWFEDVGLQFAIHWIKYLCALGMVEIAFDYETKDAAADPMEGMRYVRLTPLGRHIFGLDPDYAPKTTASGSAVDFDTLNSIITIDAKSPFQMFLANVAKRISPTRFRISAETLISGCRKKAELEQRIKNLRVIIDPEKEPALKKIIREAESHTDCAVRDGGYSLVRLRPDLPQLRETILTNYELRDMTILAGPTLALVKTHKMDRFNAILAAYGFLME